LYLYAAKRQIKSARPDCRRNKLVICGAGSVRVFRPCARPLSGEAAFTLTVQIAPNRGLEFRMQLTAPELCLDHDSGFIPAKIPPSTMCMQLCC